MNHMLSLFPDPQNRDRDLWIGTDGGGLLLFNKTSEKLMRYTTNTVVTHIKHIFEKLQVNNVTAAVAKAIHNKLI